MAKYVNSTKLQKELFKRTEGYSSSVRNVYIEVLSRLINLVKGTELEDGKPFSFSNYGYGDEATAIFRELYSRVYQEIRGDVEKEWMLSNANNDELVKSIFGAKAIEDNHFARFFQHNKEAMNAFFSRKTGEEGLSLSQKVWKYTGQYRDELENALDLAIGEGTPANKLASKIQKYLQEPDKFYRRFRVKTGEGEDGNPVYGRIWKRRVYDKESEGYKWVDDNPKKYHPGRGVYRSSYRNAQRLARTETNIAYRTADYERWQQLDFVVGIEIKLSNNHPTADICDDLKGIYPKTFQWKGWHPNCRCYMVPVLATEAEMDDMLDKILSEDDPEPLQSTESVDTYPTEFIQWVKSNGDRIEAATARGTLPYFVKDNKNVVDVIGGSDISTKNIQKQLKKVAAVGGYVTMFASFEPFSPNIINALNEAKNVREKQNVFENIVSDPAFLPLDVGLKDKGLTYRHPLHKGKGESSEWLKTKRLAKDINVSGEPVYFLPEMESTPCADAITKIKGKWSVADFKVLSSVKSNTIQEAIAKGYSQSGDGVVVKLLNADSGGLKEAIDYLVRNENNHPKYSFKIGNLKVVNKHGKTLDLSREDIRSGRYKKKLKGFL